MTTSAKLLLSYFCLFSFSAGAQVTFQRTYGGADHEYAYSVRQTSDNGYIILGSTESFSSSRDIYLIKTNSYGDTVWTKTYGGPGFDSGWEVQQTLDGGYILCGMKDLMACIIKTNSTGDTTWTKEFEGNVYSIVQTADGGYACSGQLFLSGGAVSDMFLIKINSGGGTQWTGGYSHLKHQESRDFKQTSDGGFILAGSTRMSGPSDIYLVKTDSTGAHTWSKTFGGSSYDEAYSVEQTSDNGYIIFANTNSFGGEKYYLIKTDANGDTAWTKLFDNGNMNNEGYEVKQTSDGGYVFVAETDKGMSSPERVYLVRTDSKGDTLWTKTYAQGSGVGLQITSDQGFVIIGFSSFVGAGLNDIYFVKTDSNGNTGWFAGLPEGSSQVLINVYPNPFNVASTLEFENPNQYNYTLSLFDFQGRPAGTFTNIVSGKVIIERKNLAGGLYFFQLSHEGQIRATGKVVID